MAWDPSHEGYAQRAAHNGTCGGTPSTCCCETRELWALNDDEVALTPRTGKWMFFVNDGESCDADALWVAAAGATRAGELGWAVKMSLKDPARPALMVFTRDHADAEDRELVRVALRALLVDAGLVAPNLRYKTDEATAAGVYSGRDVGGRGDGGRIASQYHDLSDECKHYKSARGCRNGAACKWRHVD